MARQKLIVSSSDNKYFILLKELFLSIKKTSVFNEYDFAVLDTGMNLDQKNYLKDNNVIIAEAKWNVEVPKYKPTGFWNKMKLDKTYKKFFNDVDVVMLIGRDAVFCFFHT